MDSKSHTKVARTLLGYMEEKLGVRFDVSGFLHGNLRPDLRCEYVRREGRHYPSLRFEEVMQKIVDFTQTYKIRPDDNNRELSGDLGEILHYITDFFCFPHNDDIYHRNLFAHYIYEKHMTLLINKIISDKKYRTWVKELSVPFTVDALISRIRKLHEKYRTQVMHTIQDDVMHVCKVCTMVAMSIVSITFEAVNGEAHPREMLA